MPADFRKPDAPVDGPVEMPLRALPERNDARDAHVSHQLPSASEGVEAHRASVGTGRSGGSLGEAYGRLRKAIRLADALHALNVVHGPPTTPQEGRRRALRLAGFDHASDETWAVVGDLLVQRLAAMERARSQAR